MLRAAAYATFAVCALALSACAPTPEPAAEPKKESETSSAQAGTQLAAAWPEDVEIHRNAEGKVACPVMKAAIDSPDKAVGYQDYEGKRYYFCCGGCPESFKQEPAKYAKK